MKSKWKLTTPNREEEERQASTRRLAPGSGIVADREDIVIRDGGRLKTSNQTLGDQKTPWNFEAVFHEGAEGVLLLPDGTMYGANKVSKERFWRALTGGACAPCCFGVLYGNFSVPDFLRTAQLSAETEVLDGKTLSVLRGVNENVEVKLWLDPELNYAARKLTRVSSIGRKNELGRVFSPELLALPPPQQEYSYVVEKFRKVAEVFVPEEVTITTSSSESPVLDDRPRTINGEKVVEVFAEKDKQTGKIIIRPGSTGLQKLYLVDIELGPQFTDGDFQMTQAIPEGTPISMEDARQIEYVWQNGRATSSVNPVALAAKRVTQFVGGAAGSRQWWIVLTASLLLLAIVGGIFYRRRASKDH
jgi:hypothetical protein